MLDLIKLLMTLRLAVVVTGIGVALVLLAVWSLTNGAPGVGAAILAAVLLVGLAVAGPALRWDRHGR